MLFFGLLLITVVMVAVCAILGRRIADLLPESMVPVGRFAFAPLLGLAGLVLAATLHGWLLPFSLATTAGPVAVLVILAILLERDRTSLVKDLLLIVGLTVIASSTVLMPLLRLDTFNPFNDTFTYLVHGQWLQSHAFSEPVVRSGFYPALTQVAQYQTAAHRMGGSFFLAFAQAAFALKWSYYAYPAVVALALTAGSLAVGGVVQTIRPCGRILVLLIAAAMATLMNGFAFGSFFGFMPQTFGLAFAVGGIGLFGALVAAHRQQTGFFRVVKETIPAALLFSALAYSYNDMLPFVALGIVFYLIAIAIGNRAALPRFLVGLTVLTAETLLIVNTETIRIVKNFLETVLAVGEGAAVIGWPVRWSVPGFVSHAFGFKSPIDGVWLFGTNDASIIVTAAVATATAAVVLGLLLRGRGLASLGLNLGVIAVFIGVFIHFRYGAAPFWPDEVGNSFLQFKAAKWVSPFVFVLVGTAIAWFAWSASGRRRRAGFLAELVVAGVVVLAVVWNFRNVPAITNQMLDETGYSQSSFNAFLAVRELVNDIPADRPIYVALGHEHHKLRQMVAYILQDRKIAGIYTDDGYLTGNIPPDEREMPRSVADWVIAMATPAELADKTVPLIGTMALHQAAATQITLDRVEGGYAQETEGINTWRWTSGRIRYHYLMEGKGGPVRLQFTHLLAGDPRTLKVTVTGAGETKLADYSISLAGGWGKFTSPPIMVTPGPVSVLLESDGEPLPLSATDPRPASFLVRNLEFLRDGD